MNAVNLCEKHKKEQLSISKKYAQLAATKGFWKVIQWNMKQEAGKNSCFDCMKHKLLIAEIKITKVWHFHKRN